MNVLIAPDKFKGSLSAAAAAQAIGRGVRAVFCDATLDLAPIADGGEGFAEALWLALRGRWIEAVVKDPLGRDVDARYVWVDDRKLAVIEMSEASGLWRLNPGELAPLTASTFGTGQLIRHATERGAATVLVGLGGSATTDGGIGMAEALGYRFLTSDGDVVAALPANLLALTRIDRREAIELPEIIAACDVHNPLLGTRGTAHVFAPQKGADAKSVEVLELCLENLAQIAAEEFGFDHRAAAGAGAAGGLGFGLMTFCNAQIRSGFEVVAEALHLEQRIAASDMVITGEGRVDAQTVEGKGPAGVADLARKHQKPVLAFAGAIADREILAPLFAVTLGIVDEVITIDDAMKRGGELLERAATRAARLLQLGGSL